MADHDRRWQAVADAINVRMNQLAWTQSELAAASGISDLTIRQLQRQERTTYRPTTLAKVARALGWTSDSIDRILDGDQPVLVGTHETTEAIARQPDLPPELLAWVNTLSDHDQEMLMRFAGHIATVTVGASLDVVERLVFTPRPQLAIAAKEGAADAAAVEHQVKKAKPGARPRPRVEG